MDRKSKLEIELKSIMNEETKDINLSISTIDKILNHRKKGLREKIKDYLNKEIQIPLAPAVIGFAVLLVVTFTPKDIFKSQNIKVIDIGTSQMIITERQVSRR